MALDYTKLAELARVLVSENGRTVDFVRVDQDPADATKPWNGPAAPADNDDYDAFVEAVPVAAVPPSNVNELGLTTIDQDLLKRVELIYIVAPGLGVTADLATMNRVLDGGVTYKVLFSETLRPATTTLVYFIGVVR